MTELDKQIQAAVDAFNDEHGTFYGSQLTPYGYVVSARVSSMVRQDDRPIERNAHVALSAVHLRLHGADRTLSSIDSILGGDDSAEDKIEKIRNKLLGLV